MNRKRIIFIILVVVVAVIGGIYLYNKGNTERQSDTKKIIFSDEADQSSIVENEPTQEVSPTPDLTAFSIKILNGSGEAGKALETKTFLEDKGFTVNDFDNADNYDYTKTVIQHKKSISPVFITSLKTALSEMFVVDEPEILDASSEADVIVIFGSETP